MPRKYKLTIGAVSDPPFDVPSVYLPTSTKFIHWSVPLHAYTSIDLDYKLTGYDWFNRDLTWSLDTAPSGMSINSTTGVISWTPTEPQAGDHTVTARLTPLNGIAVTRTWTITAGTADHIFVATTGNDTTGTGAIGAPYATLSKACGEITSAGDKVIMMRGGTYSGQNIGQPGTPLLSGLDFTESTQLLITAYPGETVIFDQTDTQYGLHQYTDYVVMDKLEVKNCTGNESAGILLWTKNACKRSSVHDSDWNRQFNCAGFYAGGDNVLDSCEAYDNNCTSGCTGGLYNNHNYIFYCDKVGATGETFVIDCLSGGDNKTNEAASGFRIKHSGTGAQVHLHRCVSRYSDVATCVGSDYSSLRHSISYGESTGEHVNNADAGGKTNGMLIDHCTIIIHDNGTDVNGNSASGVFHPGWSFTTTTVNEGVRIQDTTIINKLARSGNGGCLISFSEAVGAPDTNDFQIRDCKLYAPSDSGLMNDDGSFLNVAGINARTNSSGNTYEGAAPSSLVINDVGGGTNLTKTSWTWNNSAETLT